MRNPDFYDYDKVLKERDEAVAALQEAEERAERLQLIVDTAADSAERLGLQAFAGEIREAAVPVPAPEEPNQTFAPGESDYELRNEAMRRWTWD